MAITVCPMQITSANEYIEKFHRHHEPLSVGGLFAVGVCDDAGTIIHGVAIVGRPVTTNIDNIWTVEVRRVCTDGTRNSCSMLLGAVRNAAKNLGYHRIITYTLPEEGGASLRASGWVFDGEGGGASWDHPSRQRTAKNVGTKHRWECVLRESVPDINPKEWVDRVIVNGDVPTLFDMTPEDSPCNGSTDSP